MRTQSQLFGITFCALAATACGGGGDGGDAGADGSAGSGGSAGTGGDAGTDGSGGAAGSGGMATTTVTGIVNVWLPEGDTLIPGATVTVFGTQISTTTDASGGFTLENVPHGEVFFTTMANGHWGFADSYYVPQQTVDPIVLMLLPDDCINARANELQRTFSGADAMLEIQFYQGAEGGETGTISAPSDAPFAITLDGQPLEQAGVIVNGDGSGPLIFSSVKTDEGPISVEVTGVLGVTTCVVDETPGTTYPMIAKTITIADAYCEPAP